MLPFHLWADTVVIIDPGHGGKPKKGINDGLEGSQGSSWNNATAATYGFLEKDLTLQYSIELANILLKDPRAKKLGIKTGLTRTDDRHVSAIGRASTAVHYSADVFLSIHFNASHSHKAEGTRGYYVSEEHPGWEYLHFVNPYADRDKAFANLVTKKVAASLKPFGGNPEKAKIIGDSKHDGGDLKDGIRLLGYARQDPHLFKAVVMLLEIEFIDNPKVTAWLLDPKTRDAARKAVCQAITEAICDHVENDKPPTAPRKAKGR